MKKVIMIFWILSFMGIMFSAMVTWYHEQFGMPTVIAPRRVCVAEIKKQIFNLFCIESLVRRENPLLEQEAVELKNQYLNLEKEMLKSNCEKSDPEVCQSINQKAHELNSAYRDFMKNNKKALEKAVEKHLPRKKIPGGEIRIKQATGSSPGSVFLSKNQSVSTRGGGLLIGKKYSILFLWLPRHKVPVKMANVYGLVCVVACGFR